MFILKNIALFLAGVFLIVFGFKTNMDREGDAAVEAGKEEDTALEEVQAKKEAPPAVSLPPPAKARSPKKAPVARKRRARRTVLEKKAPEKATGSR